MAFATRNAKYTYSSVKKGGKKKKGEEGFELPWQILYFIYSVITTDRSFFSFIPQMVLLFFFILSILASFKSR